MSSIFDVVTNIPSLLLKNLKVLQSDHADEVLV